jgi:methylase of polypeptide subunit release factors
MSATELAEVINGVKAPTESVADGLPNPGTAWSAADRALLAVGATLKELGYRFTTATPETHRRVNARPKNALPSLQDVFGWSRTFGRGDIPETVLKELGEAGELAATGTSLRSDVRFSTLSEQIFVHSAYPTSTSDAVFFGPDTYRFARFVAQSLATFNPRVGCRIIDIGAGSGAGGLYAAHALRAAKPTLMLADINTRALRFSRINAELNNVANVQTVDSDLFSAVDGQFDLIISNPPYLVDPMARLYRHGGGSLGFELSLKIVEQGIDRLARGGRLVLYTGSAIVDGDDAFLAALRPLIARRPVRFAYEEIDPDVFGEELENPPYDRADRIAVVGVTLDAV